MNKHLMFMAGAFFICLACAGENLLTNSSFEETVSYKKSRFKVDLVKDWICQMNNGSDVCNISLASPGASGKYALRLSSKGKGFNSATYAKNIPVSAGDEVTATVKLRGRGQGFFRIWFLNRQGKRLGSQWNKHYIMHGMPAGKEWKTLVMRITVPDKAAGIQLCLETLGRDDDVQFDDVSLEIRSGDRADAQGKKQPSGGLKPVKMPEIPLQEELPARLRSFFPYSTGLGNLSEPEMVGLHKSIGVSRQYVIQNRRLMRHLVNHYFNAFETTVRGERHKLFRDEAGRHIQGEMARKYQVKLFLSALLVSKKDLDVENYMKNDWPRMKEIVTHPDLQKFIREYQDVIPLIFTGDGLLPQNAAVMLRAHRELRGLLPKHIAAFPCLNSSTADLMPYVPVYPGDWFPIKRKNASGHNPWSVYKEFSRLVKLAGSKPVWFVPQGFAGGPDNPHGVYALPAAGEYRLMLHLAAAAGVKGIFWHGFPNGSWPWMMNCSLYRYAPMGGAGQLMSSWQGISDAGRTFATVGPLLLKARPAPLPPEVSIQCRQFRSVNRFYDGPAIRLFGLKTPDGMLILAVNQNPDETETGELTLPEGGSFDLSALSDVRGQKLQLKLAPGDAAYIYNGPKGAELDSAFRSRYQAERSRYLLLAQQAAGDRIPVLDLNRRNQLTPRQALEKLLFDFAALKKRVEISPQGRVIRELNRIRRGIDATDFLLCRALEAAVTPDMRKNTERHARWCAHPDPEFNRLREDLAALMADYYRIRDELEEGRGSAAAARALPDLRNRADRIIPAVWAWVRKQPVKIDNPFQ